MPRSLSKRETMKAAAAGLLSLRQNSRSRAIAASRAPDAMCSSISARKLLAIGGGLNFIVKFRDIRLRVVALCIPRRFDDRQRLRPEPVRAQLPRLWTGNAAILFPC